MKTLCVLITFLPVGVTAAARLPQQPRANDAAAAPTVRVAGIVLRWVRADKEANYRRAEPLIREAARQGAGMVFTTNCFLAGSATADKNTPLADSRRLGEPIPDGPYCRRLATLAGELKIHLIAGM